MASKKKFFSWPRIYPRMCSMTRENENHFSTAKSTSFYSEFNADSEYVIIFKKISWVKKVPLSPFDLWLKMYLEIWIKIRGKASFWNMPVYYEYRMKIMSICIKCTKRIFEKKQTRDVGYYAWKEIKFYYDSDLVRVHMHKQCWSMMFENLDYIYLDIIRH
jgi:hypothetical protein